LESFVIDRNSFVLNSIELNSLQARESNTKFSLSHLQSSQNLTHFLPMQKFKIRSYMMKSGSFFYSINGRIEDELKTIKSITKCPFFCSDSYRNTSKTRYLFIKLFLKIIVDTPLCCRVNGVLWKWALHRVMTLGEIATHTSGEYELTNVVLSCIRFVLIQAPCSSVKDFNPELKLVQIYRPQKDERFSWPE